MQSSVSTNEMQLNIMQKFLKENGLAKEQLNSFNFFLKSGIKHIIEANNIELSDMTLCLKNVRVGRPSQRCDDFLRKRLMLTPQECRLSEQTYAAPIIVDVGCTSTSQGRLVVRDVVIARTPIMLRSSSCHSCDKVDEVDLAKIGECPLDPGGYFIIKGIEKIILIQEIQEEPSKNSIKEKNYVGNKRLILSGQLMSLLFEHLFKSMIDDFKKRQKKKTGKPETINELIRNRLPYCGNAITKGLELALSTGNFAIKKFRMKSKGMTQVLNRLSFIGALGHLTRVVPQFEESREIIDRALHLSQWGMFCPCDTPVHESCGLVKNLALMTRITIEEEETPLKSHFYTLGLEGMEDPSAKELHTGDFFLVNFNGSILGKHRKPQDFATKIRTLRRKGTIGKFVSVHVNQKQRCVYIASDGGRVCRPLVIADNGISKFKQLDMEPLKAEEYTFDKFVEDGLLEYLDVNEANDALIALYEGDATPETTHIEIEPFNILGVVAGIIPYPHHNPLYTNTYQCAMAKQAMGNLSYNQLHRMDHLSNLLVYPQRPLVTTKTTEMVGYDNLGAGQNATVAVISFNKNMEDAVVMNKASLDRGFGRCIVMKKYKYVNNKSGRMPNRAADSLGCMPILDDDGIAAPGEILRENDIIVNTESLTDTHNTIIKSAANLHESSYRFKGHEGEVVDRVALYADDSNRMCIKFVTRHTRRPEVGDKFSSRHGDKAVCGAIFPQEDFPFSEQGICPDLLLNPHGFQGRMTVGQMIEILGAKAAASCCKFHYGSAFGERSSHADKVEAISETLVSNGFNYNGKDFMYSGDLGCPLQAYIFTGLIYYQKSKHMVLDKMHCHARHGPRDMLTRQPIKGARIGEMDRDCLVGYGASMLICERLMLSSDPFEAQVCAACGLLGYYNHGLKTAVCSFCKKSDKISTIKMPYAFKLLIQELQSMNIVPRIKLEDA